ncbi:MAG: hypothetical protein SFV81_03180 [Pirellulaceae bacterium]|nr:hypothetical protein [Pirellulaceae bacterium]
MLNSVLRTSFCFWSCFVIATAALLWPGLYFGEVPVFRDAFHFYLPQAMWLDQCALQGDYFPQWQCNESLGVAPAGETTSALYYPLRVLWFLPALSVAQRFSVFVLAHLLLAGLGMHYACSRMQLRKEAGWLAGACFALSCPVLFQHNNLVFLSSSAWLGFAIGEIASWLYRDAYNMHSPHTRSPRLVVLSGAIAMMVLAGDPHTAVNLLIVAVFLAMAVAISKRNALGLIKALGWLAAVVLLAIGLSAVQSTPSLLWANQSHRWSSEPELDESLTANDTQSIAATVAPNGTAPSRLLNILREPARRSTHAVYDFSLSPWHALTSLWPTLGGGFSQGNSRTFSLITAEGRMWIPSLYFGILPLLLLLGGFGKCANLKSTFFVLAATFALLASFGNYSLGWLLRNAFDAFGGSSLSSSLPPDHYSSLYGLLVEWLPGYHVFRYPAKWTVLVMAFATLAAAIRFDQLSAANLTRSTLVQRIVLVVSICGALLTLVGSGSFAEYVATQSARLSDVWLGFPNSSAMTRQLMFAFAVPVIVCGLLAILRWRESTLSSNEANAKFPRHTLLAWLCLVEAFVVATCWCAFVPLKTVEPAGAWTSEFVWSDVSEANITTDQWLTDSRAQPANAIADYQREFALGKLGLLSYQHNLASMLSIEPQRYKQLRLGLARLDNLAAAQPELDAVLSWLGVEKRLVRERESGKRAAFHWQTVPESKPLCELYFDDAASSQAGSITWKWIRCGQLEIEANSPSQCRLLVRQFNDEGWEIVDDQQTSLQLSHDSSRLFIECTIEAGKSRLLLQRSEWPRVLGLSVSVLSLLIAAGILTWQAVATSTGGSRISNTRA